MAVNKGHTLPKYHPIEDGLWDHPRFDPCGADLPEAPGSVRGFFAFVASNKFQRPAGIYRATDAELAAAYREPIEFVRSALQDLDRRGLIVRDGSWVFCPGYWERQAHNPGMVKAARFGVQSCTSRRVLRSFLAHYPLHREWLPDGFETVCQPSNEISKPVPVPIAVPEPEPVALQPAAVGQQALPLPDEAQAFVELWNEIARTTRKNGLPGWYFCKELTAKRLTKVRSRLKEAELAWHRKALERFALSKFSRGGSSPGVGHGRVFRASIDWYIDNDTNCVRIMEGIYDD